MTKKEKEIEALKCLGFEDISEILLAPSLDSKWDLWKEFNPYTRTYNVGIFVYDEDMYCLSQFAQRGGVITGSEYHYNIMKELDINVNLHGWYDDNVFIQFGTIPEKLWISSGVENFLKVSRYGN